MKYVLIAIVLALLFSVGAGMLVADSGNSVHVQNERGFCTESGPEVSGDECRELLGK